MTEQMKNITKILIKLFLLVMWWTFLWSLWRENMVQLILTILYVMVIISSRFLHLHIPSNQTWVLMDKLFHLEMFYVRETISFQSILFTITLCLQKIKSINTIDSLRKIINDNVKVICYDSKDFFSLCLSSISHNDYSILSPLQIPMKEHDILMDAKNQKEDIYIEISVLIGTDISIYISSFWFLASIRISSHS